MPVRREILEVMGGFKLEALSAHQLTYNLNIMTPHVGELRSLKSR